MMTDPAKAGTITYDDAKNAAEIFPSYQAKKLTLPIVDGFRLTNPSITQWSNELWMMVRAVNYFLFVEHYKKVQYVVPDKNSEGKSVIKSRNFLIRLSSNISISSFHEVLLPCDWPKIQFDRVVGLEDSRLFEWKDELWCVSSVRELNADGKGRMLLSRVNKPRTAAPQFSDWRLLRREGPLRDEKNWMPQIEASDLRFIYTLDPIISLDNQGNLIREHKKCFEHRNVMRGGSQFISFDSGWLGVAHELIYDGSYRYYYHRLVFLDHERKIKTLSNRFYFTDITIEFCSGICWSLDGKNLIFSFGVEDKNCWIALVRPSDISAALIEKNPVFLGSSNFLGGAAVLDNENKKP